jgi:hypothetical protein
LNRAFGLVYGGIHALPCIGPEKHFRESGINRALFGLQKQNKSWAVAIELGLVWYCDAFGLGWGFSFSLAWFGRDLASVGGFLY